MAGQHENSLHGTVILVTGAAAGIGLHAVTDLLVEGAKVVMADIDDARRQSEVEDMWRVSGCDRR